MICDELYSRNARKLPEQILRPWLHVRNLEGKKMSYIKHARFVEIPDPEIKFAHIDDIFPKVELNDILERTVFITTMDTSAGGTKTACACCPKRGC
jgi:hypothetical protein